MYVICIDVLMHGLRTPSEEIAFTARPKIHSHSQIFRYGRSIFSLPHRPKFSDFFDLCLHWVSVVRVYNIALSYGHLICTFISENQGLEKLRFVSNLRNISGPAHLNFFSVDLIFFQFVNWIFFRLVP